MTTTKKIVTNQLRQGGYAPKLTDSEIITMEIVGEFYRWTPTHKSISILNNIGKTWFPNRLISQLCQAVRQFTTGKNLWYNSISLNSMGKTIFILLMAFPFLCVNMPEPIGIKPSNMKVAIVTVPQSNKNILALKDIYLLIYRAW